MEKEPAPIALFDLDGTLADYDKKIDEDYNKLKSPGEEPYAPFKKDEKPYMKQRIRAIRNQPGWWETLEDYKPGFDILELAKALKFSIYILTKGPSSSPNAWTEKVKWVKSRITPVVPDIQVIISEDKGLIYGRVLVDDWPEYIEKWLQWRPRGIVIMPSHPWNKGFSHPNVIRYDGTNIDAVKKALEHAMNRK